MPNPIRYDLLESTAVQWRVSDRQEFWFSALVEQSRQWLERNLGLKRPARAFFEAEERFDAAATLAAEQNPRTSDGGVLC